MPTEKSSKETNFEFLARVIKVPSDDCMLWPCGLFSRADGACHFEGKLHHVNRLSFLLAHGRWPESLLRHTCNMPTCFNPKHVIEADGLYDWAIKQARTWDSDECLLWPYYVNSVTGYARIKIPSGLPASQITVSIHRLAFFAVHGRWPVPVGRHTCDIRTCFNPRHIIEGTQKDNSADMFARRGVAVRGENRGNVKLNEEKVKQIRAEYPALNQYQLAEKYGVHQMTINYVVRRKTWTHI